MYCLGVRYSSEYVDRSSLKNFMRPILVYHFKLITEFAERKQATPAQIALAWEITKKPYLVPIPGTTKKERVKENFDAVNVELSPAEMQEIEEALSHMDIVGMG